MADQHYPITKIKEIIGAEGEIVMEATIFNLATDSRKIHIPESSLFFALTGRQNGHDFIAELYDEGVRNFVIDQDHKALKARIPAANFLMVNHVLTALQQLAAYHRKQYDLEIIGITGSNGKTIVKEWLYQLLSPDKLIVRNPKSFNSQIGVPLSVWQINAADELGIFEAGISTVGEMENLEAIIKPGIGILTHIGTAHDEGFINREKKIFEKLKLFRDCKLLIYNPNMLSAFEGDLPGTEKFTWSFKQPQIPVDLQVVDHIETAGKTRLIARYKDKEIECSIPFDNEAAVENAIVCWSALLAMGYDPVVADARLKGLTSVSMRMELKNGIHNCSIIDDSYNSDVQSLEIALNFLNQQNQHPKKTLILSDILQSGLDLHDLYQRVAQLVRNKNIDRFIGVGEALQAHRDLFHQPEQWFFPNTDRLLSQLNNLKLQDETILIKGSRSFEFERISKVLVQKAHETVLEINLNAVQNNLNFYKSLLKPEVKIMAMVKAFSYGSGSYEIASLLQFNKVDYLAVAYSDEGIGLRNAGISLPIMVMNPEASAFSILTERKLEPEIYSMDLLDDFLVFAKNRNLEHYPIHLKIETGMNRLGFEESELETLCELIANNQHLRIVSILSHLVASDAGAHDDFTRQQINKFEIATSKIELALGYETIKHIANTSAVSRWPAAHFDMVRVGIGLYGVDGAFGIKGNPLQPAVTLRTSISQLKSVKVGDSIGYNRSGSLAHDGKIATVRIGYADGYLRAFGNGVGGMLVNGYLAPTVGNICMDMCMIDVTNIHVEEGDEVFLFNDKLRIEEVAKQIGTIPYEILTSVSHRVKRVYYYE